MKFLMSLMIFAFSIGCATSTHYAKVNPADISANGDAIAVIDSHGCALTFFFHLAQPWEEGTLKHVIKKELVIRTKFLQFTSSFRIASNTTPCTVVILFCTCHPWNGEPSYSIVRAYLYIFLFYKTVLFSKNKISQKNN